jgi:hypothetical protein
MQPPNQGWNPAQPQVLTGQPTTPVYQTPTVVISTTNGSATWGMILGIISFILSIGGVFSGGLCCLFSVPLAFIGVILSHVGSGASKRTGVGSGEATAGLILNWLQLGAIVVSIVGFLVFGAAIMSGI